MVEILLQDLDCCAAILEAEDTESLLEKVYEHIRAEHPGRLTHPTVELVRKIELDVGRHLHDITTLPPQHPAAPR